LSGNWKTSAYRWCLIVESLKQLWFWIVRWGLYLLVYLGLPIGGNSHRLSFWEPLLNRIKSRLSGWSSKHLSFGGRLILLKSVLSSLSVYALSFFKAPTSIVSSIESLFNCFFWEGVMTTGKYLGWTGILFAGARRLIGLWPSNWPKITK